MKIDVKILKNKINEEIDLARKVRTAESPEFGRGLNDILPEFSIEDPYIQFDDVLDPAERFPQFAKRIPQVTINLNDARDYIQRLTNQLVYQWTEVNDYIGSVDGKNSVNIYVVAYPGYINGRPFTTMVTDGNNIFINPIFLWSLAHREVFMWSAWMPEDNGLSAVEKRDKWPKYDVFNMFVILHEIYHCLNLHHLKAEQFRRNHPDVPWDGNRANILMDQEINAALMAFCKWDMLPNYLTQKNLKFADDAPKKVPLIQWIHVGGVLIGSRCGVPEVDNFEGNFNLYDVPKEFIDKLYHEVVLEDGDDGLTQLAIRQGKKGVNYKMFGDDCKTLIRRYPSAFGSSWEEMYLWFNEHGWPSSFDYTGDDKGEAAKNDEPQDDMDGDPDDWDIYDAGYYDGYYEVFGQAPQFSVLANHADYKKGYQDGAKGGSFDQQKGCDINSPEYRAGMEAAENGEISESFKIKINLNDYNSTDELFETYVYGKSCGYLFEWVDIDRESDKFRHGVEAVLKRRQAQSSDDYNPSDSQDSDIPDNDMDSDDFDGNSSDTQQNNQQSQQGSDSKPSSRRRNQLNTDMGNDEARQAQENADKAQENADNAKAAAEQAQQAAQEAQNAADRGDEQGAKDAAQQAGDATQQAGQEAQQAGQQASQNGQGQQGQQASQAGQEAQQAGQQASQSGQSGQSSAQQAANAAQQAANAAQQAANAAQQAANQQGKGQDGQQSGQSGQSGSQGKSQSGNLGKGNSSSKNQNRKRRQTLDENGNPIKNSKEGGSNSGGGSGSQNGEDIDFNKLSKSEQQQIIDAINKGQMNKAGNGRRIINVPGVKQGGRPGDMDWGRKRDMISTEDGKKMEKHLIGGEEIVDGGNPDDKWKEKVLQKGGRTMLDCDKKFQSSSVQNSKSGDWEEGILASKKRIYDCFKSSVDWKSKLIEYIKGAFKATRERINKRDAGLDSEFLRKIEVDGGDSIGNIAFALDQSGSVWGLTGKDDKVGDGQIPAAMRKFFVEISKVREEVGKPIKGVATFSFSGGDQDYFLADYFEGGELSPDNIVVDNDGGTAYDHIFRNMKKGRVLERKSKRPLWTDLDDKEFPVVTVICTDSDINGSGQIWNQEMWNIDEHLVIWFIIDRDATQLEKFKETLKGLGYDTTYYIGITIDQI